MANSKPSNPAKDSGRVAELVEATETPEVETPEVEVVADDPEATEVVATPAETVTTDGTVIVDNTAAEEAPEPAPEVEEVDCGGGTVQVNYR